MSECNSVECNSIESDEETYYQRNKEFETKKSKRLL